MKSNFMKRSLVQCGYSPSADGEYVAMPIPLGSSIDGRAAICTEVRNSNPAGVRESKRVSNWLLKIAAVWTFMIIGGILPMEASEVETENFERKEISGFNRISAGFDLMLLDGKIGDLSSSLNGANLSYVHGFRLAKIPLFLEAGIDVSYNTDKYTRYYTSVNVNNEHSTDIQYAHLNSLSVRIPIGFSYKWKIGRIFSIQPYTGVNVKINPLFDYYYSRVDIRDINYNNYSEMYAYNTISWNNKIFQIGWHVGVEFNISKACVGVQYGLDFMPRGSADTESYRDMMPTDGFMETTDYRFYSLDFKSSRLVISLGYNF